MPNHIKSYQTTIYHTNWPAVANLLAGHRGEWIMWGEIKPWTTPRTKHIFIRQLHVIKRHGILNALPCFVSTVQGKIKRGGSVDDGKWDGLSGLLSLSPDHKPCSPRWLWAANDSPAGGRGGCGPRPSLYCRCCHSYIHLCIVILINWDYNVLLQVQGPKFLGWHLAWGTQTQF